MKITILLLLFLFGCSEIQQPGLPEYSGTENDSDYNDDDWGNDDVDLPDPPQVPPPNDPDNISGKPIVVDNVRTGVLITWTDNATNETGYILEWYPNKTEYDDFGQVMLNPNSSQFDTRSKSLPAEIHYFALYAFNDGGKSKTIKLVVP